MDSSVNGMAVIEDLDPKRTAIVVGPFLGLMTAPIVFQMIKAVEQDHTLKTDLIASMLTTLLCVAFMVLINNYLQYKCQTAEREQRLRAYQQRPFIYKLLSVFAGDSSSPSKTAGNQNEQSFSFLHSDQSFSGSNDPNKRKIDPKYFKPKFIISELMTFWGTTCTVITWGSFYVIGGTIVATERIAQKIKAKRSTSRDHSFNTSTGGSANRGTGHNDSFMNMSFGMSSDDDTVPSEETNRRHAFRKISSWTKRSYSTIRKRFSRVVTSSVPHFSSLTSPLNTSSGNSSS